MAYISTSKVTAPCPKSVIAWMVQGFMIAKERRVLAQLTPAQLSDIGLTSHEAQLEAARSFWDLPALSRRP